MLVERGIIPENLPPAENVKKVQRRQSGATDKPCGKEVRMRPYYWRYKYHSFPWTD